MTESLLPPGYPPELEQRIRLRNGREVLVRPIVPTDATQLADAYRRADSDTLYRRFLSRAPALTERLLRHLTTVDYVRRLALVAVNADTGAGVAVARYEPVSAGVADVAVVVDPAWRRIGLATALVELLARAALDRGVHTFSVTYLAENRPVASLLNTAGGRQSIRSGIAECAVALDRDRLEAAVSEFMPSTGDPVNGPVQGPTGPPRRVQRHPSGDADGPIVDA